jgi:hypothetical protein
MNILYWKRRAAFNKLARFSPDEVHSLFRFRRPSPKTHYFIICVAVALFFFAVVTSEDTRTLHDIIEIRSIDTILLTPFSVLQTTTSFEKVIGHSKLRLNSTQQGRQVEVTSALIGGITSIDRHVFETSATPSWNTQSAHEVKKTQSWTLFFSGHG